ncbi:MULTISPECIES: PH domain-containing protein [Streptomyces]|uniref:PH domain-containing protein n=1 Tax=Streptomyces koelreuteriae TaxID=2838015 RepID=A0ABX8FQV7_9ACTN|nr:MULTISPECIES: PH domain-containing protein [Streptomyces]QWB23412.1 PH domain-containing protein [Streptomyces koelreuteriae]UUA06366.1 PH domain-containing protein [Streptomyces koelreuteriae]UUA13995.1 PH domain-containing protein [Streptomyces sp. CRCS-T-1]
MTSPESQSPEFKDRVYRSVPAIAGGVMLLAIAAWLGIDALVSGQGRTQWLTLAVMLFVVPLVVAFTLRPAVYAGDDLLRIRNPFRVIVLPWGQVAALKSAYSNEVLTESGAKYQMWAVPVSLRARKKAARREMRATAQARRTMGRDEGRGGALGMGSGLGQGLGGGGPESQGPARAGTDQIMDELRGLHEERHGAEAAQGEVTVRWAYEVVGPAVAGAVLVAILLAVG